MNFGDLVVASIPVATSVVVLVQAAKVFGLLKTSEATKMGAMGIAFALGGLGLVGEFVPVAAPIIEQVFVVVIGASVAGLSYFYVLDPVMAHLGLTSGAEDIAKGK